MKTKIVVLSFVFLSLAVTVVYADMIEVKGRGFISGKIMTADEKEVVFKDDYGHVEHFSKAQVTYVEKEKPKRFSMKNWKTPSGTGLFSGSSGKASDKKSAGILEEWLGQNSASLDTINKKFDIISQSALDFFFRGQDLNGLVKAAQDKTNALRDYKSQNLVVGGIGMAIMFFGALAFVVFGFRLIADAFEQHFLWGVAFLAIPLCCVAPLLGSSIGLLAMVPYFASLCFIVMHWRVARTAFVAQLFSGNIILFGFFILQLAS